MSFFTRIKTAQRLIKQLFAIIHRFGPAQPFFLIRLGIGNKVQQFGSVVRGRINQHVQRPVTRLQPRVHIRNFLHADVQRTGNVLNHVLRHFTIIGKIETVFHLAQIKEQFFWAAVVPILTSDHEFNTYFCTAALIHHNA